MQAAHTVVARLAGCLLALALATQHHQVSHAQSLYQQQQTPSRLVVGGEQAAPTVTVTNFNQNVQENHRLQMVCVVSSGDLPVTIQWLKDGQLMSAQQASLRKLQIKPDEESSTLKFNPVRLEHAGNYTCMAKNRYGSHAYSSTLTVHGEPRWVREPAHEPIVATRGQTVVIDCLTTGWPRPQQSWYIKTHYHSEFEPLHGSGRISLVSNGSLVIRAADKSDEANYLCKSQNGIGKGISWSTSLKVTVPAHFETPKSQTSVVRKQSQVQLRCDAFGDEPIFIEWYKNKQRLNVSEYDSRYSVHLEPLANRLISQLLIKNAQRQDNSVFECLARNHVGRDRMNIELIVQEEPDNIQELQATKTNSRSVTLMWSEPYDGRSSITNYMFQYKKIQDAIVQPTALGDMDFMDSLSAMELASGPNVKQPEHSMSTETSDWQQASRIMVPVQANASVGGAKSIVIDKLEPSSKYVLRALAINAIGQSKFSQPMEFSTGEEAPDVGPANIRALPLNSTSIQVSWDEIPKSKHTGRIHGYYIGYRMATNNTALASNFNYKTYIINDLVPTPGSGDRLETTIHDLRRDTLYEITVVAFNSQGSSPLSDLILCKTIEMEAPKPVKLHIRRESNESIFIEWQRDPLDQNPVDDYVLYQEKNSASQEWLQVRLPANQSQYKAPGLKCGTRYQFYIIAHNKVGKSAPSEVVSASTSGALPVIPSKMSLLKMFNSTCLLVNLNAFQDNGCRIRTFTVRYRVDKIALPHGVAISSTTDHHHHQQHHSGSPLVGANGAIATHQALTATSNTIINNNNNNINPKPIPAQPLAGTLAGSGSSSPEWINIRPKSNAKHQRANEEDRMEYLCDLSPFGEYTIHVSATNDVGRSEIEYSVLMYSDELRHSALKEIVEFIYNLPNMFAYIPSIIVFLLAGLFMSLATIFLYTTALKYYQKFVIMHNQLRATRRAKRDEKRRRKLNNSRHSQKLDLWAEEYEEDEDEENGDGDDEDDDDDSSNSNANAIHHQHHQFTNPTGHYLSNIANSAFDTSSIDSPCNKFSTCSGMSTASTDSIQGRFRCLNAKQYVKMNEYTMLPSISASLSTPQQNDIYGAISRPTQQQQQQQQQQQDPNNSLYYSTLRRTNMQTYLPQQNRIPQPTSSSPINQAHRRRSQNVNDIYGYYVAPPPPQPNQAVASQAQHHQQAVANEAANSIFVPPQQIIYSAPNIRRLPQVFL